MRSKVVLPAPFDRQPVHLPGSDVEIETVDRTNVTERLLQAVDVEGEVEGHLDSGSRDAER